MKKKTLLFQLAGLLVFGITEHAQAEAQKLANYLGTGKNPKLSLSLSETNGPGWKPFSIDYQQLGSLPWSKTPAKDWSPWDVKDGKGNYYGTITLHSNGETAAWDSYTPGQDGYYLEGVHFSYNPDVKAYQLTVDKIHGDVNLGPFPSAPLATPAVYSGTQIPIVLSTQGDHIVDDRGAKIILKGLVRPSLEWNEQGEQLSEKDIQNIHAWGANVIRIDLNQNYWFASKPASEKGSYKQIINAMVYYATQNHMAIILDLHLTEDQHQTPMANRDSLRFWREVASDYKHFGTVLFELFNEAHDIPQTVWLNGNENYAGYQELYDAIRSSGADNICIINGLGWGYDLSFVSEQFKVQGHNIIYGSHPYNRTQFGSNFEGVLGKYPIIFTEFGVNEGIYFPEKYKTVYQNILAYINQNQINYTGFAWWADSNPEKINTFPDLIKDWSGTPINGGVFIHEDMQTLPGSPLE